VITTSLNLSLTLYPWLTSSRLIFCGHDGDTMGQPEWATDGSFLVIRELQQKVPEFDE
jgi:deferrochelatase/peroxidase EfeB